MKQQGKAGAKERWLLVLVAFGAAKGCFIMKRRGISEGTV
jgi:hypothetical protein